jgi:glycosyltransferase involved in cell wall biosynthesis
MTSRRPAPRPKLSIITPSLNQGHFIERTIRSVLDQGYENLEYMIVDGGSSDETLSIIRRYEDRLAWWVSEPDGGPTDALNKGLARATGDIVAYINSDDYYLPGAFDTAIGKLQASGGSWVAGAARFVDEHDRLTEVWRPTPPWMAESTIKGRHWWALMPWSVPQPSAFWRRELHQEVGPFRPDLHWVYDTEFFIRLVYSGHYPELTDIELSVRVVHPAAKAVNSAALQEETAKLVYIFGPALNRSDRFRLLLSRILLRLRPPVHTAHLRLFAALGRLRVAIGGRAREAGGRPAGRR